jgi:hypothetical protein
MLIRIDIRRYKNIEKEKINIRFYNGLIYTMSDRTEFIERE